MKKISIIPLLLALCMALTACSISVSTAGTLAATTQTTVNSDEIINAAQPYSSEAYTELNGNVPTFAQSEITTDSFEEYGKLDDLGRCTTCVACVGKDLMPTEKRGNIGSIMPTGWHLVKYDGIDGQYLYNRCHLIAYMLTAENANSRNLITGTRYMNTAMIPFETEVCNYVKSTNNHVMYRVTPVFKDDEFVARGVQMEAYSVEDKGEGVSYNVYMYNVQPGIEIDYKTGESRVSENATTASAATSGTYILNTNSKKFHKPTCSGAKDISEKNKKTFTGSRADLINQGYKPCGNCKP